MKRFTSLVRAREYAHELIRLKGIELGRLHHPSPTHQHRSLKNYLDWGLTNSKRGGKTYSWPQRLATLNTVIERTEVILGVMRDDVLKDSFITSSPSPKTKAKSGATMNLAVLALLARDPKTYEGLNEAATSALAKAQGKRREQQEEQLGEVLVGLLEQQELQSSKRRKQVRQYEEHIADLERQEAAATRAFAYASETNNYVPWAYALGHRSGEMDLTHQEFAALCQVPEDWTPKEETEEG